MTVRRLALAALAVALAAACGPASAASAAPAGATPAQMQAAYDKAVTADGGFAVYDPARGETLFATGDATMVAGTDYSRDWGYPHMVWVAQTGPAAFTPLRLYQATVPAHHGWQPVPDSACPAGKVFWTGGLLYAAGARQVVDYGQCVNPADGSGGASYAASFDAATLAFQGPLRPLGGAESWSDAVAVAGGWWLLGSRYTGPASCLAACFTGDTAFVPAGGQLRPSTWRVTRGTVPASANPGNVITPFLWGGRWLAVTKAGDKYGSSVVVELAAPAPASAWAADGKSWPTAGANTYSAAWHGGYITYASETPYQLNFEGVSP